MKKNNQQRRCTLYLCIESGKYMEKDFMAFHRLCVIRLHTIILASIIGNQNHLISIIHKFIGKFGMCSPCRRKRGEKGEVVETIEDVIVRRLTAERIEELKRLIKDTQEKYRYVSSYFSLSLSISDTRM